MKRSAFLGLVPLLLQSGLAFAADEPRVLAPSSGWTLDFADERCSLIREFADGDDRIRLQIDAFGPAPGYRVMVSGDLVPGSDAAPLSEFRVAYSPDAREREKLLMMRGRFQDENAVSFGPAFLPEASADKEQSRAEFQRSVTHVTFAFRLRNPFQLDTGSMAAPFAAMDRCVDDLLTSWGVDPAEHRTRSRPPVLVGLPEGYERVSVDMTNDRPGYTERRYQAIARAQAARNAASAGFGVPVRVMIDASGRPTACVVQAAAADESFRNSICDQFAGPYDPALDADGKPMASFVQLGIDQVQVSAN